MPSARVLAALAVALAFVPVATPPAASQTSLVEAFTVSNDSAKPPHRFEAFDASAVGVFDLDGDGAFELLAHNDNNHAYVFDGGTGALLAEITTKHPRTWGARELNGVSVGDVNGNDVPDIVVANSVGWVTAFEARPGALPGTLQIQHLWESFLDPTRVDPSYFATRPELNATWTGFPGLDGAAFLADVTGDGRDEVFAQTDNVPGNWGLNADGSTRWFTNYSDGNGNPVADDIDRDGSVEAVFASDGGQVYVYDGSTGIIECKYWAGNAGARPASISVAPELVDVTGDGRKEIVFGARQAVQSGDADWMKKQHAHYFALTPSCNLLWHAQFEWGNPHVYMHAGPIDLDGDKKLDLVLQDWNTIGYKPGNWEVTGKSNLFAVKGSTGELLWRLPVDTYWSNKDVAIADVTGDDAQEILVVAPRAGEDGITFVSLAGKITGFLGVGKGWEVSRGPAVADLDGDGLAEIIVPIHRKSEGCVQRTLDVGCREGALKVFRTGKPLRAAWDGVFLYSRAYDYERKPPRAPAATVAVTQPPHEPGVLAIALDVPATSVHVKRTGTAEWVALAKDASAWSAAISPRANDTFLVRVVSESGQLGFAKLEWKGQGPGRLEGRLTDERDRPMPGVNVTLERRGAVVATATTDADGRYRLDAPEGRYLLVADAGEDARAEVTVRAGEIASADLAGEREQESVLPTPGVATLAILVALGAVALAVRKRP